MLGEGRSESARCDDDLSPNHVVRFVRVLDRITSAVLLREKQFSGASAYADREQLISAFADLLEHLLDALGTNPSEAVLASDAPRDADAPQGAEDPQDVEDKVIVFGEFVIDALHRQLTRSGETLEVQPRVLELLHYLALNAGRTVTREELMQHVWTGVVISDATLNYTVSRMRRLLGQRADAWLQTIRGRGYRFVASVRYVPGPNGQAPA